ncbi:hypothetical protein ACOSQ4_026810 [Xanthoceras sorbifolium]
MISVTLVGRPQPIDRLDLPFAWLMFASSVGDCTIDRSQIAVSVSAFSTAVRALSSSYAAMSSSGHQWSTLLSLYSAISSILVLTTASPAIVTSLSTRDSTCSAKKSTPTFYSFFSLSSLASNFATHRLAGLNIVGEGTAFEVPTLGQTSLPVIAFSSNQTLQPSHAFFLTVPQL